MQSQGVKRGLPENASSDEKRQLERSAEMFEMILQTAPQDVQTYQALKEIYRQLKKEDDLKRISRGLAEVYLGSGQRQQAAREYMEVLEFDPSNKEAARQLEELGYGSSDLPLLKVEATLKEIRGKYERKLKELREGEEAYAQATGRVRDLANKQGEEKSRILRTVQEEAEKKTQQLIEEKQRWLEEGRTELFNQVAKRLKEEADRIIQTDRYGKISRSVKEAERLVASTDAVFQEEWRRVTQQREKEFHERFEQIRREKEEKLGTAWDDAVLSAKEREAAAEKKLCDLKDELQSLESELKKEEALLKGDGKRAAEGASAERLGDLSPSPRDGPSSSDKAVGLEDALEQDIREAPVRRLAREEAGKTLGAILVQHGVVSPHHLEEAIAKQKKDHRPIGEILVHCGYATEEDIINALVAQAGVPYLQLSNYEVSDEAARAVPKELAIKYSLMPVDRIGGSLLVAMGIPLNGEQKHELQQHLPGMRVTYFISSWSDIKAKHEDYYGSTGRAS